MDILLNFFYRWLVADVIKLLKKGIFPMSVLTDFQTALDAAVAKATADKQAATDAVAALAAKQAELDAANAALVDATAKLNAMP